MALLPETQAQTHTQRAGRASFFRSDIEGLRAVAVLLVIGAHFALPGLSAGFIGVDIFFVISGYLITGILTREYESTASIGFARFYTRRLRRLLPALATMLIVSSVLAFKLLPRTENLAHSQAAAMAAVWVSNIYFAFSDIDYFGAEVGGNAFLHTWSLGVEEQFYLVWPLLIFLTARWAKGKKLEPSLVKLFVAMAVLSLGGCLLASRTNPIFAFYMMPTRAWQFSAGALVWLLSRKYMPTALQAATVGWAGVVLLVASLVLIGPHSVYPGVLALLPTLGACALLWTSAGSRANQPPRLLHPGVLLSLPPMQAIGRLSYSWYLWHWPAVIFGENLLLIKGYPVNTLVAIAASLLAAILTHHLIENPIRYGQRVARVRNGWQIACALSVMVVLNSQLLRWHTYTQDLLAHSKNAIYARAVFDMPAIYPNGCDDWYHSAELKPCVYGKENAQKTAVLLGDSIGAQWFPTLTTMLDPEQWKITVLTKSSCPMVDEPFFYQRIGREYTECATWRNRAIEWLQGRHIDQLFLGSAVPEVFTDQQWTEGTRRILDRLARNADAIYLIEANPQLGFNGPTCLMQHDGETSAGEVCSAKMNNPLREHVTALLHQVVSEHPKTHWIETASLTCPQNNCQAWRNGRVVYRDAQHLTASFVASPEVAEHFQKQMSH